MTITQHDAKRPREHGRDQQEAGSRMNVTKVMWKGYKAASIINKDVCWKAAALQVLKRHLFVKTTWTHDEQPSSLYLFLISERHQIHQIWNNSVLVVRPNVQMCRQPESTDTNQDEHEQENEKPVAAPWCQLVFVFSSSKPSDPLLNKMPWTWLFFINLWSI